MNSAQRVAIIAAGAVDSVADGRSTSLTIWDRTAQPVDADYLDLAEFRREFGSPE